MNEGIMKEKKKQNPFDIRIAKIYILHNSFLLQNTDFLSLKTKKKKKRRRKKSMTKAQQN